MMQDFAMHLLEIIMNSVAADCDLITIRILDDIVSNLISAVITDNGKGMSAEMVERVANPFTTSRTSRKVGMGVSFLKGLAESCDGDFHIESEVGVGTTVSVSARKDHLDTPPLGDLGEMMMMAIQADEKIDYEFTYGNGREEFFFSTREIKEELAGVSLLEPDILLWIKQYINENIMQIKEGM